ncbi:hypothetical protein ACQKJG_18850 [Priestia megaterium]|uniref:hypothetical protein n=1 Tax=Priestia megaterium TaxID=1404 RepID=UPI003D04973B
MTNISTEKLYPKMRLSQFIYPENNDAYMHFVKLENENGSINKVPYLVSNHKQLIRLDQLDVHEDSFGGFTTLVEDKYMLPSGFQHYIPSNLAESTLQAKWVKEWQFGKIPEAKLHPKYIVNEIESAIRAVFHAEEEEYPVLALWVYATYFYTVFDKFPMLSVHGKAGSGKSTLNSVIDRFAFNSTYLYSTSAASLYGLISGYGGTFIFEDIDKNSEAEQDFIINTILKGSYYTGAFIQKTHTDGYPVSFNVYGPKVVTARMRHEYLTDRVLELETKEPSFERLKHLMSVEQFEHTYEFDINYLTSRAALSALEQFHAVNDAFKGEMIIQTSNGRIDEMVQPLAAVAKVVGGKFLDKLINYVRN